MPHVQIVTLELWAPVCLRGHNLWERCAEHGRESCGFLPPATSKAPLLCRKLLLMQELVSRRDLSLSRQKAEYLVSLRSYCSGKVSFFSGKAREARQSLPRSTNPALLSVHKVYEGKYRSEWFHPLFVCWTTSAKEWNLEFIYFLLCGPKACWQAAFQPSKFDSLVLNILSIPVFLKLAVNFLCWHG